MTQSAEAKRQQLIDDSELLLDRIEAHGFELDKRICVLRSSGDPIELPIDLDALVRIATFCSTANLQLQRVQEVLTTDQDYASVKDEGSSEQERPESERFFDFATALHNQLTVNREQAHTIAELVQLLKPEVHHELQRHPNLGVDSNDARHALPGVESGHEVDSESGRGTPRYSGQNAF